jgi:hypothetical protein
MVALLSLGDHVISPMTGVKMYRAEVAFERPRVENLEKNLAEQFQAQRKIFEGKKKIAIAAGSRGVANLAKIIRATVDALKSFGTEPFIVPAMGSHGGATDEGQAQLLASFGITEKSMDCPVRSSMQAVELDSKGLEHCLFMDRNAHGADGVVLVNRIKPHTDFHGRHESGLSKMAVIGLGKEKQASEMHQFGVHGLRDLVPKAAERIIATGKITAGVAIVENAYEETACLEVIPAVSIMKREAALLKKARANMPRLPIDEIDILVVDEMGKNVSGSGLDTNVIGRIRIRDVAEPRAPRIKAIMVDDLTEESHGNGTGTGLADVVTRKLVDKIDWKTTNKNIVTSSFLERGKLPVVGETTREAFEIALRSCGVIEPGKERIIRIKNTLHLVHIYVSACLAAELRKRNDVKIERTPRQLFGAGGKLLRF